MCSIEIKNVSKKFRIYHDKSTTLKERILFWNRTRYSEHQVLDNISLNIEKGKTVGLIGENGSGKSTLLKLISKIIYPDSGEIITHGKVSSLLELGAGFHPDFSGRENIYFNASIFGFSQKEIDKKFDDIVAFSELEEFIDNPVRTYSSGMYMRLAFSVAINVEPDILLIDEILAVGDASFQKKCMNKIIEFKELGKTIVIVSHSEDSIKKLCDNVVWLENGNIKCYGETQYAVDQYLEYMHKGKQKVEKQKIEKQKIEKPEESNKDVTENILEKDDASKTNIAIPKESPERWGSKEVEITKVTFLNSNNEVTEDFEYGESLRINIQYKVNADVKEPVFGIGVFLPDGTRCYGTNTSIENLIFEKMQKGENGKISFLIDQLYLVNGTYLFNIAVHAMDGYAYDYLNKMFKITIYSKSKDIGIFKPKHRWIVD